jgi:hypothetical protein
VKVSREQAHAWRLRRQLLDPRGSAGAVEAIRRLCGVQAQVASAAELAVRVRQAAPETGAVERAIADGSLVKTWAMRGTLHLLPSTDAGDFLSLIASARTWEKGSWQRVYGATPQQVAALVKAVPDILDDAALTREELVGRIVAHREFASMEEHLRSGWGSLLKPLAWQGALCHGLSQGNKVTFTRPDTLPGWKGIPEPDEAAPAAISAYLGAYGPATPEVFDAWLSRGSLRKGVLRGWFAAMGDRLTTVDVDGQDAHILSDHADDLAATGTSTSVRLLGAFDQYVLGPGTSDRPLLPAEHRDKVSKAAGWISPIVVVDGRIAGVWELDGGEVSVSLFGGADRPLMADLEAEVAHLAVATGTPGLGLSTVVALT